MAGMVGGRFIQASAVAGASWSSPPRCRRARMRKDVRAFIRRLVPAGLTVEPKPATTASCETTSRFGSLVEALVKLPRQERDVDGGQQRAAGVLAAFDPDLGAAAARGAGDGRVLPPGGSGAEGDLGPSTGHGRFDHTRRGHPGGHTVGRVECCPMTPPSLRMRWPRRRSSASGARAAWRLLVSLKKTGCEQARKR
jgi:hypothetical protein